MQVVEPKVSTDCRFLTSTIFFALYLDVKVSKIESVANNPSGTFATIMPITKTIFVIMS